MGFWVEIVTLVVPGFNDSSEELTRLAEFIASVSPEIPWHVTAFHTDYKMENPDTPAETLLRAAEIGRRAGLKFVYAGNLPGETGELENTICPNCGEALIQRWGYHIRSYRITAEGRCPKCKAQIPGRWAREFDAQVTSVPFVPRRGRARDSLTVLE
jgi:pyruvate formate lyase activating enzyme